MSEAVLNYWAYGYGGNNNVFPFSHAYKSAGMRVWGASGFSGCDGWAGSLPPLEIRSKNTVFADISGSFTNRAQ